MKQTLLFYCFFIGNLLICTTTFAQPDEKAIARIKGKSLVELHDLLINGLKEDSDKVRAFYVWITHNIKYDTEEYLKSNPDFQKQYPEQVLKNRKGVCQGYAQLFHALCKRSGIECYVLTGVTKNYSGVYSSEGHAWIGLRLKNEWKLIDPTWGAGIVDENNKFRMKLSENYYVKKPEDFLKDHYPVDPAWQLVKRPISLHDFKKVGRKIQTNNIDWNCSDTLLQWSALDSSNREFASAVRMLKLNPDEKEAKQTYNNAVLELANTKAQIVTKILDSEFPTGYRFSDEKSSATQSNNIQRIKQLLSEIESFTKLLINPGTKEKVEVKDLLEFVRINLDFIQFGKGE